MLSRRSFRFLQSRLFATQHRHTRNSFYYEVLEIPSTASQTQIKEAYFKLSKIHHPDVSDSEDSKLQFQLIADAYTILGNIHSRRMYDRGLISGAVPAQSAKPEEEEFNPFKLPPKPVKSDLDKEVMQRYRDISEQRRWDNQLREGALREKEAKNKSDQLTRYQVHQKKKAEEKLKSIETGLILIFFFFVGFVIFVFGQHGYIIKDDNVKKNENKHAQSNSTAN